MISAETQSGDLTFLKLGGSLLTDKTRPESLRAARVRSVAVQIADLHKRDFRGRLLLGIGAGSFGHFPARQHGLTQGLSCDRDGVGAAQTADAVARLARHVASRLLNLDTPAWVVAPNALFQSQNRRILRTSDVSPVHELLKRGILPIVHGDVLLDSVQGVCIASTESVFIELARTLRPRYVLLASDVRGVWKDPGIGDTASNVVPRINDASLHRYESGLEGSRGIDITGGMVSKVEQALELVRTSPVTQVLIFDGRPEGAVRMAVESPLETEGTLVSSSGQTGFL